MTVINEGTMSVKAWDTQAVARSTGPDSEIVYPLESAGNNVAHAGAKLAVGAVAVVATPVSLAILAMEAFARRLFTGASDMELKSTALLRAIPNALRGAGQDLKDAATHVVAATQGAVVYDAVATPLRVESEKETLVKDARSMIEGVQAGLAAKAEIADHFQKNTKNCTAAQLELHLRYNGFSPEGITHANDAVERLEQALLFGNPESIQEATQELWLAGNGPLRALAHMQLDIARSNDTSERLHVKDAPAELGITGRVIG